MRFFLADLSYGDYLYSLLRHSKTGFNPLLNQKRGGSTKYFVNCKIQRFSFLPEGRGILPLCVDMTSVNWYRKKIADWGKKSHRGGGRIHWYRILVNPCWLLSDKEEKYQANKQEILHVRALFILHDIPLFFSVSHFQWEEKVFRLQEILICVKITSYLAALLMRLLFYYIMPH